MTGNDMDRAATAQMLRLLTALDDDVDHFEWAEFVDEDEPPDDLPPLDLPSPPHEWMVCTIDGVRYWMHDVTSNDPARAPNLSGTSADPRAFNGLAAWSINIAGRLTVEPREVTMEMLLNSCPGDDVCLCGSPYCLVGPFIAASEVPYHPPTI